MFSGLHARICEDTSIDLIINVCAFCICGLSMLPHMFASVLEFESSWIFEFTKVTYLFLFGMRVCPFCPDCNNSVRGVPCNDIFGSNAFAEGGIFGRIDAGYTSIEAQKSTGSLHAHSQLFVQCLHQHTPLVDIMAKLHVDGKEVISQYLTYKSHVSRQVYSDPNLATERLPLRENEWPEYKDSKLFLSRRMFVAQIPFVF